VSVLLAVKVVKELQPVNALSAICNNADPALIETVFKAEHPSNALFRILLQFPGIVTDSKLAHPLNVLYPITKSLLPSSNVIP
jgi:hypothetical protein